MEEKKQIKVSLGTVFLVIAIILIVVMGALLYMQKTESDKQIAELESNASKLQETINDLQGKIDTISNTINSDKTPDSNVNEITKLSDEKVKEVLQNYIDLMDAYEGTPAHLLYKLELMTEQEFNKSLGSNIYKTDIKFSEYKEAMLNYVSENWFNQKFVTLYNKTSDANEYLQFEHLGTSIGSNEVESVTIKGDYNALTYIAKVYTIASDGVKLDTYNVEFTLENLVENNETKTVISYCDELKY